MSERKSRVDLVLGNVRSCSGNPLKREFTVQIFNSLDMEEREYHIAEGGIMGFKTNTELEDMLENLRQNIKICYHGEQVDEVVLEGE